MTNRCERQVTMMRRRVDICSDNCSNDCLRSNHCKAVHQFDSVDLSPVPENISLPPSRTSILLKLTQSLSKDPKPAPFPGKPSLLDVHSRTSSGSACRQPPYDVTRHTCLVSRDALWLLCCSPIPVFTRCRMTALQRLS